MSYSKRSYCYRPWAIATVVASTLTSIGSGVGAGPAMAQSITISGDTDTQVTQVGDRYTIDGNTLSGDGANLFHSFQEFGLTTNEIAEFIADPTVQNILGRVVGGQVSLIDGLIEVTGTDANLFLMNPAGMIFGPNAQLNVPGDFTATSATGIGIGNDWFSALGDNDYAALVGDPSAFAFGADQPGTIVNLGTLAVGEGQALSLVGGTVVNEGTLEAPGGSINVAAVPGQNVVRISQDGFLLSLEIEPLGTDPIQPNAWTLPIASLPELLTGGNLADALDATVNADGSITLQGSGVTLPTDPGTALVAGAISTATDADTAGSVVNVVGDRAIFFSETIFGPPYDPDIPTELAPQPGELTGSLDETTALVVTTTNEISITLPEPAIPADPDNPDPAQGPGLFFSVGTGNDDEGDLRFTTAGAFVMGAEDNLFSRGRDLSITAGALTAGEINTFDGAGANYFDFADDDRFPQRSGNVEFEVDGDIEVARIFGEDVILVSENGNIVTGPISSEADTFAVPAEDGVVYELTTTENGVDRELDFDSPVEVDELQDLNNVLNQGEGSEVVLIAENGAVELEGYIRAGQTNKTSDSLITVIAERFQASNPLTVWRHGTDGQQIGETPDQPITLVTYSRDVDPPVGLVEDADGNQVPSTTGRNNLQANFGEEGLLAIQFGNEEPQVVVRDANNEFQTLLLSELDLDQPITVTIALLGDRTFTISETEPPPIEGSGLQGGFGVGGRRDPSVNPGALNISFAARDPLPPAPGTVEPSAPSPSPIDNSLMTINPPPNTEQANLSTPTLDFEPISQVVCEPEDTVEVGSTGVESEDAPILDISAVVSRELSRSAGFDAAVNAELEDDIVTECD